MFALSMVTFGFEITEFTSDDLLDPNFGSYNHNIIVYRSSRN